MTQLPRGPHGLSRDEVQRRQRDRLLQATTDEVAERGYANTTVAHIIKRAGVSRATFYELFDGMESCFQAAFDANAELVAAVLYAELEQMKATKGKPLERLDHIVRVYLESLAAAPTLARVFLVESYAAGPAFIEQRHKSLERFVDIVAETHRGETGILGTRKDQRFAVEAIVGAVSWMTTNAVAAGETDKLPELRKPLMKLAEQITRR